MIKKCYLLVIAICSVALFSSCLDDEPNDDNRTITLSKQEIALRNSMLHGTWEGKIYFVNTETQKADSIYSVWKGDSVSKTITFENFPVKVLANYLEGETKNAIEQCDTHQLVFDYITPTTDLAQYDNMQYFRYSFVPKNMELSIIAENNELKISFVDNLTDYSNVYKPTAIFHRRQMQGNILVGSVTFNNNTQTINRLLSFSGNKIGL